MPYGFPSVARPGVGPPIAHPLDRADVAERAGQGTGVVLVALVTVHLGYANGLAQLHVQPGNDGALHRVATVGPNRSARQNESFPSLAAADRHVSGDDQNPLTVIGQVE